MNRKIAVAGTGYVGLSLAVLLAQKNQVTAVDIVPEKVEMVNNKKSPIQDEYIEKYLVEKQREPTIEELVSNLQIDQHSIIEAIQSTQSVASFQEIIGHDDQNELHLIDMIPLDKETLKHYHQHLDLKKAMTCLNPREQKVNQERYYKGYSQCEIAKELFVSQAQVSRIEKNALEKLHKKLV